MKFLRKDYRSHSDEELMTLVGRGEIPAFDELYARYSKRILFYFHKMLARDEERAQDLLHDLFLKLVERPELYTSGRRFSTWVFSIAHNMCKNEYRSWQVRAPVECELDEIPFDAESPVEHLDRETFRRMLELELEALDPDQRTTFLLRYQEEFSIRQISEALGCPEGTVKSRLFNTVRRLAGRLKPYNPNAQGIDDYEEATCR